MRSQKVRSRPNRLTMERSQTAFADPCGSEWNVEGKRLSGGESAAKHNRMEDIGAREEIIAGLPLLVALKKYGHL
jgi:hypothetical protein